MFQVTIVLDKSVDTKDEALKYIKTAQSQMAGFGFNMSLDCREVIDQTEIDAAIGLTGK